MHYFIQVCLFLAVFNIIQAQSSQDKALQKMLNAKAIIWGEHYGNEAVLAQMKKTNQWGLYEIDRGIDPDDIEVEEIVPPKFDSLSFFEEWARFQIVKQGDQYGIYLLPTEIHNASKRVNCKYEKLIHKKTEHDDFVLVRENGKWGLIDWFEEYYIVDPAFDSPDEVPLVTMNPWMVETFQKAKKELKADVVIFDPNNGDGVLKARNKQSKKWGMYQFLDQSAIELIPMEYDSLDFFSFNANYTAVYKKDKVGIYLAKWSYEDKARESVPCQYEDYKRYSADGVAKLAVQKNEKWGWIDWLTGEEKSEFIYETTDDLPYPYYKQNYYPEK